LKIIKRNGKTEEFFRDKVVNGITLAMDETEKGVDFPLALDIAVEIENRVESYDEVLNVEDIQNDIDKLLFENGRFDVTKRHNLYREEKTKLRNTNSYSKYQFLSNNFLTKPKHQQDQPLSKPDNYLKKEILPTEKPREIEECST